MDAKINKSTETRQKRARAWIESAVASRLRFGHLEVIGPGPSLISVAAKCHYPSPVGPCGKELFVKTHGLRSGVALSCGCMHKGRIVNRVADAIATQKLFGYLQIIAPGETPSSAIVRCTFTQPNGTYCGKEFMIETKTLWKGRQKTCSCGKEALRMAASVRDGRAVLVLGATAGDWTISKILVSKRSYWMRCSCGFEQKMLITLLKKVWESPAMQKCQHIKKPAAKTNGIQAMSPTVQAPTIEHQEQMNVQLPAVKENKKRIRVRAPGSPEKIKDIKVGSKFGFLEVLSLEVRDRKLLVKCTNEGCNKEKWVAQASLMSGAAQSCSCVRARLIRSTRAARGTSTVIPGTTHANWSIKRYATRKNYVVAECMLCHKEGEINASSISQGKSHSCCGGYKYAQETMAKLYGSHMPSRNTSAAETEIAMWVRELCPAVQTQVKVGNYQFDICVPERKLLIEYHGLYWHSEGGLAKRFKNQKGTYNSEIERNRALAKFQQSHHAKLSDAAAANGYSLVQIWEHEWTTRKEQVQGFLRAKLGACNRIGARELEFRPIDSAESRDFCERYHIQGRPRSVAWGIGGFHNGILLVCGVFASHHRKSDEIVLSRFCSADGWAVAGALAKISSMAYQHFKRPIKTWVHRTLSNGKSYESAGWLAIDANPSDYFYFHPNEGVFSKQSKRLNANDAKNHPELTEREIRSKEGYLRVWDAGKIVFQYGK